MHSGQHLLLANYAHHVLRKTRNGKPIFHRMADYCHCLKQIHEIKSKHRIAVHAWALLLDRIHVVATPLRDSADLTTFMKALTCRISLQRRKVHDEKAPWDRRFRASMIEPGRWTLASLCYVERLPVLHGLAQSVYHYPHTSYKMRVGKTEDYWLDDPKEYLELGDTAEERVAAFRRYMQDGFDKTDSKVIETALRGDRPTGSAWFLKQCMES